MRESIVEGNEIILGVINRFEWGEMGKKKLMKRVQWEKEITVNWVDYEVAGVILHEGESG